MQKELCLLHPVNQGCSNCFRRTGRTDHSPSTASLRHPGDLAKSSQQVLRQCMSLSKTIYLGKVSSHCPVRIGPIGVIPRTTASLKRFTGRFVRHFEAESTIGLQHPVNAMFGCQAWLRRLGLDILLFDILLFDHYQASAEGWILAENSCQWLAYAL